MLPITKIITISAVALFLQVFLLDNFFSVNYCVTFFSSVFAIKLASHRVKSLGGNDKKISQVKKVTQLEKLKIKMRDDLSFSQIQIKKN